MITVAILINGNPIIARSAVRKHQHKDGSCEYNVDDGRIVLHSPEEGTCKLAIKMLEGIQEEVKKP